MREQETRVYLIKTYILVFLIVLLSIFIRTYRSLELFRYSHDQDLLSWFVKDVAAGDIRLIGQETSVSGVFIGPLFYYLAVPFYLVLGMSPVGGVLFVTLLGAFTVFSVFWVFRSISGYLSGIVGSVVYGVSFYAAMTDREVVPTTFVMLWGVWFLHSVFLIKKREIKKSLILAGLLFGLVWHISLGLILLLPVYVLTIVVYRAKISLKGLILGLVLGAFALSPFVVFELRNGLSQIKAILYSGGAASSVEGRFGTVVNLFEKNLSSILGTEYLGFPRRNVLYLFLILLFVLGATKVLPRKIAIIFLVWFFGFILFFTYNSLNPSEYYLNGAAMPIYFILSITITKMLESKKFVFLGVTVLFGYFIVNSIHLMAMPINKNGYLERSILVDYIYRDAKARSYPCVSVSYITSPGFDLGYRYLFYLKGMHVNEPKSGAPVYTIVFPQNKVDSIDQSSGAIGLIYPDFERYTPEEVLKSCSGMNSNLTDPLFGYIK